MKKKKRKSNFLNLKKYTFTVKTFEGEPFSQAPGVLDQVCDPAKIAARQRCGLPNKNLRAHFDCPFCVTFLYCIDEEPPRRI